jgi:putative NIF3 family GTP cyclohydrolase 1 type 2
MVKLADLVLRLDAFFKVEEFGADGAFSKFLPMVYDPIGFDWKNFFEPKFAELCNGLMIQGGDEVNTVFLAVFPTEEVLAAFCERGRPGDLLYMHHPLLMECGDPRGAWGRGFVPVPAEWLAKVKACGLSIYTVHGPMDYNLEVGTTAAMAEALDGRFVAGFLPHEDGFVGQVVEVEETSTAGLIEKLQEIFEIPYVDFEGETHASITRVALVAGCGDKVEIMMEAQELGAQAYVSGEIHCHIDNDYGRYRYGLIEDYAKETGMSLIGVSHSASEYLVKKTQMKRWLEANFDVKTQLIAQHQWWL